jgi:signal transduction histidine kinase
MRLPEKTIRVPLTLAFALLLALIVAAAAVTLTRSVAIFDLLAQTHDAHDEAAEALQRLRSDLYLAGILKRDFLLDRDTEQAASYGEQFAAIQASADQNLKFIESSLGRQQPETVRKLRSEVTAYMRPLKEAFDWDPIVAPWLRAFLLRAQVKQRTAALQMAAEIEKLNADSLKVERERIRIAESDFRRSLLAISSITVLIGLIVAIFTIVHTHRLERHSEEVRGELKRLSQHVVRAQEIERRNLSRELHDEVGQMLTGLRMELANLDVPGIQQNAADYHRLQEAKRLTERTLQCVRNLSMVLRPSMLDDLGLSPALRWQAKEFSRRSGIPVDLSIDGDIDAVPDDVRTCVYRVVQEALTNVSRHADAHRIKLLVRREGERMAVTIEDDGKGFDVSSSPKTPGIGLLGMKERVSELSGTTRITSEPGKGTHIAVHIPVPAPVPTEAVPC